MRKRRALVMMLFGVVLITPFSADGAGGQKAGQRDTAKRFVGTWRLVSVVGGTPQAAANRGSHSTGVIFYDGFGNMAAQIMPDRVRPKYANPQPTPDEAKAAITGYTAYFGTYTIDEKARTVTHHRKGNINPGGLDDGVRHYEFAPGDRLILTPDVKPPTPETHLTWERMK
jgi:lipocalin-like protein